MRRTWLGLVLVLGVAALSLSACSDGDDSSDGGVGLSAGDRTVYMAVIEPKGTANIADEPFPEKALPDGGGYALEEADEEGNWTVETYRWLPGEITVVEGDQVTLEILGVNGASHPGRIEGYDVDFEVKRGQLTTVEFTADKQGIFKIICDAHQPAMTGALVVLPAA